MIIRKIITQILVKYHVLIWGLIIFALGLGFWVRVRGVRVRARVRVPPKGVQLIERSL